MRRAVLLLRVLLSGRSGAQTFLSEGFETTGFVAVDGGFTMFNDVDPVSVFSWTGDAGVIRGAQALVLSNAGCTEWDGGSGSTSVPLSARTVFSVKLVSAGPAEVRVVSPGLLGGATLQFTIEPFDAGTPDAGLMDNDAGRDPQRLAVGCSCSSASGALWSLPCLAILLWHRLSAGARESRWLRPACCNSGRRSRAVRERG